MRVRNPQVGKTIVLQANKGMRPDGTSQLTLRGVPF